MNWGKFFGILLAPAILSAVLIGVGVNFVAALGVVVALVGSVVVGVVCAVMLARHIIGPELTWVALAVVFSVVFIPVSLGLCFVGCGLAGAK